MKFDRPSIRNPVYPKKRKEKEIMMRKRPFLKFLWLPLILMTLAGCPPPPATVPNVEIDRYLGLWYQVAGYPFFATENLVGVTAEYSLLENGNVRVFNRGFEGDFNGPENTIIGEASVIDPSTNAKLTVRFPEIFFGLFAGEYWIIRLDEVDYNYAVVSDSMRNTLYILSRTPTLDQEILDELLDSLAMDGFDLERIQAFPQLVP